MNGGEYTRRDVALIETKNPQKIVDVRNVNYSDEYADAAVYVFGSGGLQCSLASVNCSISHL